LDSYKILKQAAPGNDDWAIAYTCPVAAVKSVGGTVEVTPKAVSAQTQTLVTSILVACHSTGTYSIALKETSAAGDPNTENIIVMQKAITQNTNDVLSLGLTLGPDNTIWFKEDTGAVSYTIMGIEIT